MVAVRGTLTIMGTSLDGHDFEFEALWPIFDLSGDSGKTPINAHNLPRDPVSIAIAAAMGMNWGAIVDSCASGDDGISFLFNASDEGFHSINLPPQHPSQNDPQNRFIRCGHQSIEIMIDDQIQWQVARIWPSSSSDGKYIDRAHLSIPRKSIPESLLLTFQDRQSDRLLTLHELLKWEGSEIPDVAVDEISFNGDVVSFNFDFPSDIEGRSKINNS